VPSPNPARGNPDHPDFPHGTRTGYQYGCRAECCRAANSDYCRQFRRDRGTRPQGERMGHGTRACYLRGCRLEECVEANRRNAREYARAHYGRPE
jgi:hypothetical protein